MFADLLISPPPLRGMKLIFDWQISLNGTTTAARRISRKAATRTRSWCRWPCSRTRSGWATTSWCCATPTRTTGSPPTRTGVRRACRPWRPPRTTIRGSASSKSTPSSTWTEGPSAGPRTASPGPRSGARTQPPPRRRSCAAAPHSSFSHCLLLSGPLLLRRRRQPRVRPGYRRGPLPRLFVRRNQHCGRKC